VVKVELSRIIIDEKKHEQVVVLRETNGARLVPIVVGLTEAASIRMHLNQLKPPRPLTHDLTHDIITAMQGNLSKVVIDKLIDNTFHAKLHIEVDEEPVRIVDCRPSDAIALSVRFSAPIFIADNVFARLSQEV
jgi:bifunctional DNase/RNase